MGEREILFLVLRTLKCHAGTKNSGLGTSSFVPATEAQHKSLYPTFCTSIPIQDRGPRRLPKSFILSVSPPPTSINNFSIAFFNLHIQPTILYSAYCILCISTTLVIFNLLVYLHSPCISHAWKPLRQPLKLTETPGMHHRSTKDIHRKY